MTNLTTQQAAILSEGICPLCHSGINYLHDLLWQCSNCRQVFESEPINKDWAVGWANCTSCGHDWVAVRPVDTTFLQCPKCGESTEQD